jgi:hypothetical protein
VEDPMNAMLKKGITLTAISDNFWISSQHPNYSSSPFSSYKLTFFSPPEHPVHTKNTFLLPNLLSLPSDRLPVDKYKRT